MKVRIIVCLLLSATSLAGFPHAPVAAGSMQQPTPASSGSSPGSQAPAFPSTSEKDIDKRNRDSKGIRVEQPKVYDDTLLQQMLQSAEARLAAMQVLDQASIAARLGSVVGATQRVSSFGLNVQGPSLPGTEVTANDATGNTVTVTDSTGTKSTVTSNLPTRSVVTTVPQANPPAVSAPVPTTSLPTSYSVSSSDILNEQMQLMYEIANLRLLLEGSLSDRFDKSGINVKPRVTLGFPIKVEPDKRYKEAVAVVEVEVQRDRGSQAVATIEDDPPAITALLPREKTYNVAAITDRSTSLGGGVVTQLVGVSASWLRGRKSYYLVQDQDTVALTFDPDNNDKMERVGFMWQFRPVLGQEYVRSGLRQTFVQLAFSKALKPANFGFVYVRTYWRRYDRKKGIAKEVIPGSLYEYKVAYNIPSFRLVPESKNIGFSVSDLEDLGGGQMLVSLVHSFLSGTYIRIGGTTIGQGSPNFTFEQDRIRFAAPIADLATKKVKIVGRDGTEEPLLLENVCESDLKVDDRDVEIKTVDQANSLVKVTIKDECHFRYQFSSWKDVKLNPPLVLVVGNRVFGYSDAPIQRDDKSRSLIAVVPTSLLVANPKLIVKALFQRIKNEASIDITGKFGPVVSNTQYMLSQTERLIPLGKSEGSFKFVLYGNRLKNIKVLEPKGVKDPESIGSPPVDEYTVKLVELKPEQIEGRKYLLLSREGERPFLVEIPSEANASKPGPKATERITVGADEVVIEGEGLKDLDKVTFKGKVLPITKAEDGKSVRVKGLSLNGVTAVATTQSLDLWFKDRKTPVKLEIVNNKVETVSK